jgi:hypothetical protein
VYILGRTVIETSCFWRAQLSMSTLPHPPEDGDRSSHRNDVVFCKTSTYKMDRVQKKSYSSVQHTPSSESFQVYLNKRCVNIFHSVPVQKSRDSVVGIATGYGLADRGVWVWVLIGSRNFSISSRQALRPIQPPIQWVPGAVYLEVEQLGHEADHSPPNSANIKKMWIYTSTPPYTFMA